MAELIFRPLRASEIDARIGTINKGGVRLLLYKDARVDQSILDETVGPYNWQKSYSRDNANCTVSIWDEDKEQWISKEDTGIESFSQKEKGLASDSFKRACFNWGIGRALYESPDIFIPADKLEHFSAPSASDSGKCAETFKVTDITYSEGQRSVTSVTIAVMYYSKEECRLTFGEKAQEEKPKTKPAPKKENTVPAWKPDLELLRSHAEAAGSSLDGVSKWLQQRFKSTDLTVDNMTEPMFSEVIKALNKQIERRSA